MHLASKRHPRARRQRPCPPPRFLMSLAIKSQQSLGRCWAKSQAKWASTHPTINPCVCAAAILECACVGVLEARHRLWCLCPYSQIDLSPFKGLKSYEHRLGDTVTGYKFQCVELARRFLVANRGVVFDSIPMAYNICVLLCRESHALWSQLLLSSCSRSKKCSPRWRRRLPAENDRASEWL